MLYNRIGHVESSTRLLWQYYIDTKIMRNVKVHTSSPTTTTTTMIMIRTIFNGYNYGNIPVRTIQMDRVGTHVDGVIAMFAKII